MAGLKRRLEALEGCAPLRHLSGGSVRARARMLEHLDQMVRLKRGELGSEEAAEVEAYTAFVRRCFASRRGEGIR